MSLSNFRKTLKNVSWVIFPICIFAFTIFVFLFVNTVTLYTAPDEELTYAYLSPDESTMFISVLSPDRSLKLSEMTSDGNFYSASFDIQGVYLKHLFGPVYINESHNFITFSKSGMPIVSCDLVCTFNMGYVFEVGESYNATFEFDSEHFYFDHKHFPEMRRVCSEGDLTDSEIDFLYNFSTFVE